MMSHRKRKKGSEDASKHAWERPPLAVCSAFAAPGAEKPRVIFLQTENRVVLNRCTDEIRPLFPPRKVFEGKHDLAVSPYVKHRFAFQTDKRVHFEVHIATSVQPDPVATVSVVSTCWAFFQRAVFDKVLPVVKSLQLVDTDSPEIDLYDPNGHRMDNTLFEYMAHHPDKRSSSLVPVLCVVNTAPVIKLSYTLLIQEHDPGSASEARSIYVENQSVRYFRDMVDSGLLIGGFEIADTENFYYAFVIPDKDQKVLHVLSKDNFAFNAHRLKGRGMLVLQERVIPWTQGFLGVSGVSERVAPTLRVPLDTAKPRRHVSE